MFIFLGRIGDIFSYRFQCVSYARMSTWSPATYTQLNHFEHNRVQILWQSYAANKWIMFDVSSWMSWRRINRLKILINVPISPAPFTLHVRAFCLTDIVKRVSNSLSNRKKTAHMFWVVSAGECFQIMWNITILNEKMRGFQTATYIFRNDSCANQLFAIKQNKTNAIIWSNRIHYLNE